MKRLIKRIAVLTALLLPLLYSCEKEYSLNGKWSREKSEIVQDKEVITALEFSTEGAFKDVTISYNIYMGRTNYTIKLDYSLEENVISLLMDGSAKLPQFEIIKHTGRELVLLKDGETMHFKRKR